MNKSISDRDHRYGQLIIDFANAKTSDQAGLIYLENIKRAFNFPEKVKSSDYYGFQDLPEEFNEFPTISKFKASLNNEANQLLDFIVKEKQILSEILSIIDNGELRYKSYDALNKIITFEHIVYSGDWDDINCEVNSVDDFTIENIRKHFRMLSSFSSKRDSEATLSRLIGNIETLMEVGTAINDLRQFLSEKEFERTQNFLTDYEDLLKEHDHIKKIQAILRLCLNSIVSRATTEKNNIYAFNYFIESYNDKNLSIVYQDSRDDGSIKIDYYPSFDASLFLNRFETMWVLEDENLKEYYNEPLAYCLIEYLKDENNQKYLKKCDLCRNFYIAAKLIQNQKRCSICSPKTRKTKEERAIYQQKYRKDQKARKKKEKEQAKIERLIDAGYSPKKAKELALIKE